jgi:hypothetical protein
MKHRSSILSALLCLLWLPSLQAADDAFIVGVGTHVTSDHGLDMMAEAGVTWLREDIHWDEVERQKGVLQMPARYERYVAEALRRGIKPDLILCYGNPLYDRGGFPLSEEALEGFARYAEFVVKHFQGRVQFYEVWNEWNYGIGLPNGHHPGDAAAYVKLLAKVYPRLKALDPKLTVLGGAMSGNGVASGWFEAACQAGMLDHLDGLSYHPYCWRATGPDRTPERGLLKLVVDNQVIAKRYRPAELPVYLTEIGWPTHQGKNTTSVEENARFLARTFLLMRTVPFIKGVWWYDFRDDGRIADPVDPERNFGIVYNNFAPKPAYFALLEVCRLFETARYVGASVPAPGLHLLEFRNAAGKIIYALWSEQETETRELVLESASSPGPAKVTPMGENEIPQAWETQNHLSQLHLQPSPMPTVVDTGLSEVKVLPVSTP